MNKSKEKILVKKEKLIFSYLLIITSIFGIFFYTFIIIDGIGFLVSIIIFIMGVSLRILLLKGKLTSHKVRNDENLYLIVSIIQIILGVLHFLMFIDNPYESALNLIISLAWLEMGVYSTLLYVRFRKI